MLQLRSSKKNVKQLKNITLTVAQIHKQTHRQTHTHIHGHKYTDTDANRKTQATQEADELYYKHRRYTISILYLFNPKIHNRWVCEVLRLPFKSIIEN